MSVRFRERAEFVWGEQFERALSTYLQARGWGVLPVYNFSGAEDDKAPLMCGPADPYTGVVGAGLVLPDLLLARDGRSVFVEAKRKTRADFTRKTQRHETGISHRLYQHYEEVRCRTGLDVFLFFGHELEGEVRWCKLGDVPPRVYDGQKMGRGGMVFWGWEDDLAVLCSMAEVMALAQEDRVLRSGTRGCVRHD